MECGLVTYERSLYFETRSTRRFEIFPGCTKLQKERQRLQQGAEPQNLRLTRSLAKKHSISFDLQTLVECFILDKRNLKVGFVDQYNHSFPHREALIKNAAVKVIQSDELQPYF